MAEHVLTRRAAVKIAVATMLVTVAIAVPSAVLASHRFTDVPDSHTFHREINAIADAGITGSFADGSFRPSNAVTRQAMAAFLQRGLGRVTQNRQARNLGPNESANIATVTMGPGAAVDGQGFVWLTATAQVTVGSVAACPCRVLFDLEEPIGDFTSIHASTKVDVPAAAAEGGGAVTTAALQALTPIFAGGAKTFNVRATVLDTNVSSVHVDLTLTATYAPFGPGGSTLPGYCFTDEAEPNDTIGTAPPLLSPVKGCIDPPTDRDVYSIVLTSSQPVTAETTGLGGAGTCEMDTTLRVRASNGSQIAFDDNSGTLDCSRVTTPVLAPGTYYVEVASAGVANRGAYRLTSSAT